MTGPAVKKSDLGVRTVTAIVMLAVAGSALWLGGWFWAVFAVLVAVGVYHEWTGLVRAFATGGARLMWMLGGSIYVGLALVVLIELRGSMPGSVVLLTVLAGVICTDIGAYFAGRTIGGPKIAPRISPSKTWAGLGGGVVGATFAIIGVVILASSPNFTSFLADRQGEAGDSYYVMIAPFGDMWTALFLGAVLACSAQAGDFFESWLKRRAGVKDSGKLLPGHGGLFDRVDGLIAVCFIGGAAMMLTVLFAVLTGEHLLPDPA